MKCSFCKECFIKHCGGGKKHCFCFNFSPWYIYPRIMSSEVLISDMFNIGDNLACAYSFEKLYHPRINKAVVKY